MTGRERVAATLRFLKPDRIPLDIWCLDSARIKYGDTLQKLLSNYDIDICRVRCPLDRGYYGEYGRVGLYEDLWGSTWKMLVAGITGEVVIPAIKDISEAGGYKPPYELLEKGWYDERQNISEIILDYHRQGKLVIGGPVEVFQRMQWLRGSENLYCDLGLAGPGVFSLCEILTDYYLKYLDYWLELDIDAVCFTEDWGTQINLLISPVLWRSMFRPVYKRLFDKIKASGKFVFFHSDGYILDIYPDLIELGVDAINSQIWCMGVENAGRISAGKVTFWGELDRQGILPFGSPRDVLESAELMKKHLYINGGGLIGQGEIGPDVPLENIRAMLECWQN
jgi:uroporphyrinogen decarboxylase